MLQQASDSVLSKSIEMAEKDPHGIMVTVISISVVFAVLFLLYLTYSLIGGILSGKSAKEDDGTRDEKRNSAVQDIVSPLPGRIIAIKVKPGDRIEAGQTAVILEAMKMENEISATHDGRVISVYVHEGDIVPAGFKIITIE